MPSITCVITSYNNLPYLKLAVDSVLSQTKSADEIVIADDGSTDGSQDYLRGIAREFSTIRLVLREHNLGVAENRGLAIRDAESELITTLDGDDVYHPEKLASELDLLSHEKADIAFSNVDWIDTQGITFQRHAHDAFANLDQNGKIRYLLHRHGPIPRDMMYSRQLFETAGGYHPGLNLYEDWDLKLRLARLTGNWKCTGLPGIGYRHHDRGLSRDDNLTHLAVRLRVISENCGWLREEVGDDEVYRAFATCVANGMGYREVKFFP